MPVPAPQLALWLDPFRSLAPQDQAQLSLAGLSVCVVRTQDALQAELAKGSATVLVLGLGSDISLLVDSLCLLQQQSAWALPVICRVERRYLELAVSALRHGACHALAADDWSLNSWASALACAHNNQPAYDTPSSETASRTKLATPVSARAVADAAVRSVVYVDPVSRNLLALAQRVAQANVTVLIEGPTGSGKEVLARVLHESSPLAQGPFIGLNCAAMPEHMIEDMLFGHEKGAFTGAVKEHRGLFEQAQGGTLFLDEIAELALPLQAKLLRVLQERSLVRLGGEKSIALELRVLAATNQDLRQAIARREFREDLYFRLSTFKLRIPPLSERRGDIPALVSRLLARQQSLSPTPAPSWEISPAAQAQLLAYAWPGNVRELENVVQRAMVLCPDQKIDTQHLLFDNMGEPDLGAESLATHWADVWPAAPTHSPMAQGAAAMSSEKPLQAAVKHSEQHVIRAALESSDSRIEAAQKLGISPRTLRYKLARLREANPALALNP
ncbi:MAG: sigma-54 dependent transcriptional regulator [Burkholderiaceae bacterium]